MNYTMVVLIEIYPSWLALSRKERRKYAKNLYEIIEEYKESVIVRFFDAEALPGASYTDFMICETNDLKAYHFMWEKLRDTAAYGKGYFKIKDVIMGMKYRSPVKLLQAIYRDRENPLVHPYMHLLTVHQVYLYIAKGDKNASAFFIIS
jgi:hypothetical protein